MDLDRTLRKIVSNLWFEWNSDVHLLFRGINSYEWGLFRRNLYRFLKVQSENHLLYRRRILELLVDADFLKRCEEIDRNFKAYMEPTETIVSKKYPSMKDKTIAYFSMEYGIDILRIYSGGLGILSGDHLRGASDLGLKMVGVGLFYLHGYYNQRILQDGSMKVNYEPIVMPNKPVRDFLPLEPVKRAGTLADLIVTVPIADRKIKVKVWRAKVGRVDLLLLDTNLAENHIHDRHTTRRLYASQRYHDEERRRRLEQEMVLGIGGAMALEGAGYQPSAYHLNEGHVGFAAIEVFRQVAAKKSISFTAARELVAKKIGFTTHTPVAEGNERFDEGLVRHNMKAYLDDFATHSETETIFNCARNRENMFDMTKLSLLLCEGYKNGVSALHGEVCRKMWWYAWGNQYNSESQNVPIGSITNAVHGPYWQKPALRQEIEARGGLQHVYEIPDEKIWAFHQEFKTKLIEKARERFVYQLLGANTDPKIIRERTLNLLDPDAFMIGFARRFADYKRVTLLLDDEERLFQFLEAAYKKYGKPVHIIYAGKPHPNNNAGRDRIRQIVQTSERLAQRCQERGFLSQIIFIQGYDIEVGRYLTAGVDIWLNNPIRPLEASGTSGMKAGMNGVLNVSISDGWVPEGVVTGKNGWLFGRGDEASAVADRNELFELLEKTILPIYFERQTPEAVYSHRWVEMMKNSIQTITAQFSTDRMLQDYVEKMYLPAVNA